MKARRPTLLALFFLPILYLLLRVWKLTVSETWFTKPIPSYHPEMPRNKLPKKQGKSRKTPITLLSAEACNSSLPPKVQVLSHPKRSMAWQKSITSTGLVVSHCSADIPWLGKIASNFDHVVVYSKCGRLDLLENLDRVENLDVVVLSNIGSCDGVYLHHITARFDLLSNLTLFWKDTGLGLLLTLVRGVLPEARNTLSQRQGNNIYCLRRNRYNETPSPETFWISFHPGFRLTDYPMSSSTKPAGNAVGGLQFHPSGHADMLSFHRSVLGDLVASSLFQGSHVTCMKGMFGLSRDNIHRHTKKAYLALHRTQQFAHEEVDHYIERSWGALAGMKASIQCPRPPPGGEL